MNQQNIFSHIAAVFRFFFGKISHSEFDEIPFWLVPAAGLFPGLIIAAISASFVFCMGGTAGGIMAALFAPLALELLTGWRGISISVASIERLLSGKKLSKESPVKSGERSQTELMQRQIIFASLYIFRMAAFGVLASTGNAVWIIYTLGGAYLIRGELLLNDENDFLVPQYGNWIFYGAFCLAAGILAFHWSALIALPLAFILTALCLLGSRRLLENISDRTEFWLADFLGYISENVMLIAGLVLFGRFMHG